MLKQASAAGHLHMQLVRNATVLIETGGKRILVDPALAPAGSGSPIPLTQNRRRNPLVPLPVDPAELRTVDALLVTHHHGDHLDQAAADVLPKGLPVYTQPESVGKLKLLGFTNIRPVASAAEWQGLTIIRTGGSHGSGLLGKLMGPVSGFVLKQSSGPSVYLTGDTVYNQTVGRVLEEHQPDVTVANTGAARFLLGRPITMTASDVEAILHKAPGTHVVAVHLEAVNHATLTRRLLREYLERTGLNGAVSIPADGEWLHF